MECKYLPPLTLSLTYKQKNETLLISWGIILHPDRKKVIGVD